MIGSHLIRLDLVDSTNNYAATELLTKSLTEGTVVIADCQSAGRGQEGASWESAPGQNLTFSVVLYPVRLPVVRQFCLSKAISLGVADFLSGMVPHVSVKWPNDIYAGDKKIAGILIETAVSGGKFSRSIVGIGLNVNQEAFLSGAPNPVSLKNLTGKEYDLKEALDGLCRSLDVRYKQLLRGGWAGIDADYERSLYRFRQWAYYRADGVPFEGRITGIDPTGCLEMETREGSIRRFQFKEVVFV